MVIDQVQLGDVTAVQTLHVVDTPTSTTAATTSVGNSGLGTADHADLDYRATQRLSGGSHALANITVDNSAGDEFDASTSATGNTGTASNCCGALTGSVVQTIDAGKTVTAETYSVVSGPDSTGVVNIGSSAIGNTQGWENNSGSITSSTTQTHSGDTYAAIGASGGAVDGPATYSATAVANNVTADAGSAPVAMTVDQTASGGTRTRAGVDVSQTSGSDVVVAATATNNNINVTSDGFDASLVSRQTSGTKVEADANLTLGSWSGTAVVSGYGVANSAIVSNSGPSTEIDGTQTNSSGVLVTTSFTGGSDGADATAISTAAGNAYSGYACPDCNGTVSATLHQANNFGVTGSTVISTSSQGAITGVASAVGNTATFQSHRP